MCGTPCPLQWMYSDFAWHKENHLQEPVAVPGGPNTTSFGDHNRSAITFKPNKKIMKINVFDPAAPDHKHLNPDLPMRPKEKFIF